MAFLIYKKIANGKTVCYEKVKPLKLSGRDGLIARHVQTLSDPETQSWKLDVAALLKLVGIAPASDALAVLFDVAGRDATSVCLYELARIHGSCCDNSTQLALDFSVVIDREIDGNAAEFAGKFEITRPAKPKFFGEMLALTGGPGGGDWKWDATSLQLGATVVQPHHTGPPYPNCTADRKAAMS
jgi:hypothetical protein